MAAAGGPDAATRHREVAGEFTVRVDGVRDWTVPTPVQEWTARDVVGHLVEWLTQFLAAGGVVLPAGPEVAADPAAAWRAHADAVQALLDDPAVAVRHFRHPVAGQGRLGDVIDRFYTTDVFLHTWDLARATGQNERLDPKVCGRLLAEMRPLDALLRASGQYGPQVPVPADADAQSRLLGFIGRDPSWVAPVP